MGSVLATLLKEVHQVHMPNAGSFGSLFGEHNHYLKAVPGLQIDKFVHLVCCPSLAGSHIIDAETNEPLYKVKQRMAYDSTTPRYDIHNVRSSAYGSHFAFGYLEKLRIEQTVSKGLSYRRMEAWHASIAELEGEEKTGILRKFDMPKITPKQAWSVNFNIALTGSRDQRTQKENWRMQFAFSDSSYTMEVGGDAHVTPLSMQVARIYHNKELVCVARRQDLAHMSRAPYERPFLGIQIRMDHKPNGANEGYVPEGGDKQVLPILLALAWCEETINPPEDKREHLIRIMRSNKKRKTPKWARVDDDVELEVPVAEGLGEATILNSRAEPSARKKSNRQSHTSVSG